VDGCACGRAQRGRSGGGPSQLAAEADRMTVHNPTDHPSRYQDQKDYDEARSRDPIERVQKYLAGLGLWDSKREAQWTEEIREENDRALKMATEAPAPRPEDVFANVYEEPPPRVIRQRADLV